jgi:hypothetical protein
MIRRFQWKLLVPASLMVGMALGILLTFASVIWPRQLELSRIDQTSPFLSQFEPRAILAGLVPDSQPMIREVQTRLGGGGRHTWGRTFTIEVACPSSEQSALVIALVAELRNHIQRQGGVIRGTGSTNTVREGRFFAHQWSDYEAGSAGDFHLLAWGEGEVLRLWLSIHER